MSSLNDLLKCGIPTDLARQINDKFIALSIELAKARGQRICNRCLRQEMFTCPCCGDTVYPGVKQVDLFPEE